MLQPECHVKKLPHYQQRRPRSLCTPICNLDHYDSGIRQMSSLEIVAAYRNLYKLGLRAVRSSQPPRYVLRDILRRSFREESASSFDQRRITNTYHFLRMASIYNSFEHRIVKNILVTRYWRDREKRFPRWSATPPFMCLSTDLVVGSMTRTSSLSASGRLPGRILMRLWSC